MAQTQKPSPWMKRTSLQKRRKPPVFAVVSVILSLVLGGGYLSLSQGRYQKAAAAQGIRLAQSLNAVMHPEHLQELTGGVEDLNTEGYQILKRSLFALAQASNSIRNAYLMRLDNNRVTVLVDAVSPGLPSQKLPGQIYSETISHGRAPFGNGSSVVTDAISDSRGSWVSVLVPMLDPTTGSTIAVFAIDFSQEDWLRAIRVQMLPDFILVISFLLLFMMLMWLYLEHRHLKEISHRLSISESLFRSIFEQAPLGVGIVDVENFSSDLAYDSMNLNNMYMHILGRSKEELRRLHWSDITHPDDIAPDQEQFRLFFNGDIDSYKLEKRYIRPDGSLVWTNLRIARLEGQFDTRRAHICILEDITERKKAEEALQESERSKSVFLNNLPGLAYRCRNDSEWTMQYVSSRCLEVTGYGAQSLIDNRDISFSDIIAPAYRQLVREKWAAALLEHRPFQAEYEIITADGTPKWVVEYGEGLYNSQGNAEILEGIIIDISDKKTLRNTLRHFHEHDQHTGLHNRASLEKLLKSRWEESQGESGALICFNFAPLQSLTSFYGFHYTQEVIKQLSLLLQGHTNEKCLLFLTHVDRFTFYNTQEYDDYALVAFARAVCASLEGLLLSKRISGGVSIVRVSRESAGDVDQLLKLTLLTSERAMTFHSGEMGLRVYNADLKTLLLREEDIKRTLVGLIENEENEEFYLQYQPIVDLRSGRICGFEALSRLRTAQYGLIPPNEFIAIAEKSNLIIPLGRIIFRRAFAFLNTARAHGNVSVNILVNIAATQLLKSDFTQDLCEVMRDMQVNPANVELEITESVFTSDYAQVNQVLQSLKDLGIRVAIDDFGTGYSSLARLRDLHVSGIKIDKAFIDTLMPQYPGRSLVGDIISMAHKLGLDVTAEGVEHEVQRSSLLQLDCDKMQGFLFARPLDEADALALMKDRSP